jgi:hypothetical protein
LQRDFLQLKLALRSQVRENDRQLVAQFRASSGSFGEFWERVERRTTGWLGGPDSNFDTRERYRLASQIPDGTARDPHVRKCHQRTFRLASLHYSCCLHSALPATELDTEATPH